VPSYASSFPTNTSIGFYTVQDWRNIEETPCPDNHITWSVDPWDIGQGLGLDAILETTHPMGGASIEDCVIDSDSDEIPDWVENWDADGDGVPDKDDAWPFDPCVSLDYDSDGLADLLYYVEECETSVFPDIDHDNDWVKDTDDFCWYGDLNWTSGAVLGTDHDGDGCRDDGEDTDDDGDGVEDADDQCPRGHIGWISNPMNDIDGDGCHEIEDYDRDGDGFNDIEDAFPNDPTEWLDSDGDGVGDNAEKEKVEDGGTDYLLVISIFLSLAAVVIIVSKRKFS
jgi:hypothetical protein